MFPSHDHRAGNSFVISFLETPSLFSTFELLDENVITAKIESRLSFLPEKNINFSLTGITPEVARRMTRERSFLRMERKNGESFYYNPIPIVSAGQSRTILDEILQIINDDNLLNPILEKNKDDMILQSRYERFFKYILPIKSFNMISILEHLKRDLLLNEVVQANNLFGNIKEAAIKTLFKLNNLNDPRF